MEIIKSNLKKYLDLRTLKKVLEANTQNDAKESDM